MGAPYFAVGSCGLIPIGLDANTIYTDGTKSPCIRVTRFGQLGPYLHSGAAGGGDLRRSIANGYNSTAHFLVRVTGRRPA